MNETDSQSDSDESQPVDTEEKSASSRGPRRHRGDKRGGGGSAIARLTQSVFFQGWPLVLGAVLIFALFYKVWDVLAPPVLGLLALYLLYPYRQSPFVIRIIVVTAVVLVMWLLADTGRILFPFMVAFILAYLFNPLVSRLEGWRIPRIVSSALILVVLLGLTVVAGRFFIPLFLDQLFELVSRLPESVSRLMMWLEEGPVLGYLANTLDLGNAEDLRIKLFEGLAIQGQDFMQQSFSSLAALVREIPTFFGTLGRVLEIIAVPFIMLYLLKDFNVVMGYLESVIPRRQHKTVMQIADDIDDIISRYMRGQGLVAVIIGVSTGALLTLFQIKYAMVLGLVTGVLNIIPYFGFIVSLILGILVAFFDPNPMATILTILAIFIGLNTLESMVISPRIVGHRVGLHPVWIILSLLIFFHFFGFLGLVIAVPATAVGQLFIRQCYQWYLTTPMYSRRENDKTP